MDKIFPIQIDNGVPTGTSRILFDDGLQARDCAISELPISDATQTALETKVDKVTGKGLSTEDYTTLEKNKLSGIEAGAEVNPTSTDELTEGAVNKYDKVVSLLAGAGITVTGTYPNFTVTNSSPDQVVTLTEGANVTISGTYPNFTISSTGGGGGGSGDVVGPASSTNNGVALFDGTTGKLIKDSAKTIVTTLGSDDTTIPTSKAVADAIGTAGSGDMLKSVYDTNNDGIVNQADVITNQGDLATLDTVNTDQIDNSAVTNGKLAHMNSNTLKGRLSGNGVPQDISMADLPISTATQSALDGKVNLSGGNSIEGNQTFDSGTLYIDATNNRIGIGTTNPDRELEIKSTTNARIRLSADSDNVGADDEASILMSVDGGSDYMKMEFKNIEGTASNLNIFGPTSPNALIIDGDNGNISLSTTTNTYKLNVSGDVNVTGTLRKNGTDIVGLVGTKAVDETAIADDKILVYKTASGKYELEDKPSGGTKEFRITIPGEQIADTSNYQGLFFRNTSGSSWTISNVAIVVGKAAAGSGAACAVNLYKSSGTDSNGINTSATNLFTSAIDLGTSHTSLTNVPNTTTVENGRWLSARITSSAGATNRASDLQIIVTYT